MFKTWFIALRPWSFTAAAVPVTLGAVLAWHQGYFNGGLFVLTLLGGVLLQAGTNLINTYGDYISGVDTVESAVTCPQLVRNILKPRQMKTAGIIVFLLAALIGSYLVYLRGWPVLILGLIGVFAGYTYTLGPAPYKYSGLGSILVFFLMGPLMVIASYYVQAAAFSGQAILISLPIGFLVSAILHANDLRDIDFDCQAGIKTLALKLGRSKSYLVYYLLNIGAVFSLIILLITKVIPFTALLPLVLLPQVVNIFKNTWDSMNGSSQCLVMLEAGAAKFHFHFGLMFICGWLLDIFI